MLEDTETLTTDARKPTEEKAAPAEGRWPWMDHKLELSSCR